MTQSAQTKTQTSNQATRENRRVLLAMSGDVDSAVTASLLKSQGYEVVGVYFQLWDPAHKPKFESRCTASLNPKPAADVCDKLGIAFHQVDLKELFNERVADYFVHELIQLRTPNPCIPCNMDVRFAGLYEYSKDYNCKYIATGHYAQVIQNPTTGLARILRAVDKDKDQSYYLFALSQAMLQRTLMPLGGLSKAIILRMAEQFGLNATPKPIIQKSCFSDPQVNEGFVHARSAIGFRQGGTVMTTEGKIVGKHSGLYQYHPGQVTDISTSSDEKASKYIVVKMDASSGTLVVGEEKHTLKAEIVASRVQWVQKQDGLRPKDFQVRYSPEMEPVACTVIPYENDTIRITFREAQRGILPGQAAVLYDEDEVMGGAWIDQVQ